MTARLIDSASPARHHPPHRFTQLLQPDIELRDCPGPCRLLVNFQLHLPYPVLLVPHQQFIDAGSNGGKRPHQRLCAIPADGGTQRKQRISGTDEKAMAALNAGLFIQRRKPLSKSDCLYRTRLRAGLTTVPGKVLTQAVFPHAGRRGELAL
jgi:hypothetical protein